MQQIPKIIHIIWVGDETKRPDECIKTWKDNHPDWDVRVHGNELYEKYKDYGAEITRIPEINGHADLFRWLLLHDYGGITVDADSISVRPLPDWMRKIPFTCYESETLRPGLLACGAMGFTKKHPIVTEALKDIINNQPLENKMAWETVGTQCLTRAHAACKDAPFKIYPSHYFIPKHFAAETEYHGDDVYAKQLWASTLGDYGSDRIKGAPVKENTKPDARPKLMIAIPNTGNIRTDTMGWAMSVNQEFGSDVRLDWRDIRGMPVDVCRNQVVQKFLESDNEWLMMVDSDVLPPVNVICTLAVAIKMELAFVGFPTPIFSSRNMVEWNFGYIYPQGSPDLKYPLTRVVDRRDWVSENITKVTTPGRKPIISIDRIGTGCVLIRRDVFEAVQAPAFEFPRRADGSIILGEDYWFCDKVRKAGFDIWCDLESPCEHFKNGMPLSKFMQY